MLRNKNISCSRTYNWLMASLVLVNLALLVFLVWQVFSLWPENHRTHHRSKPPRPESHLSAALQLSADQQKVFAGLRDQHLEKVKLIRDSMRNIRKLMADNMVSEQPDTVMLDSLSNRLGHYHSMLRKLYVRHFFDLRNQCNEEQKSRIGIIYRNVMCCDENYGPGGYGHGRPDCKKHKGHKGCGK